MKTLLSIAAKKSFVFFAVIFLTNTTYSQSLQWLEGMGSASASSGATIKTDATGNVITGGMFTGTVDFNTTAATNSLAATGTNSNGFIFKQTAAGAFTWVQGFLGAGSVSISDITTDATGNIYVTGGFTGTIDFNPGVGTNTLSTSSSTDYDVFICKLTSAGAFVWVKEIGNTFNDLGYGIALDASNNVFVGGYVSAANFSSTLVIDLDPSAAVNNFTIVGSDGFVVKLDNNGNYLLGQDFGGNNVDYIFTLEVDASNNVVIGGSFYSTMLTLGNPTGSYGAGFVSKLSNTLVGIWSTRMLPSITGNAKALDLEVDASGNVYATGEMFAPGPASDVVFTGGVGTFTFQTSQALANDFDAFLTKIAPNGDMLWAKHVGYGRNNSRGTDLSLDGANNIYLIGYYKEWVDFNYGGVPYYRSASGTADEMFISKYNTNGVFLNDAQSYGNSGAEQGLGIQATSTGAYYVTGYFSTTVNFTPYVATNNLTATGTNDIFIAKYASCTVPAPPTATTPTLITMCANTTTVQSVASVPGYTYTWYNLSYTGASLSTGASFTTPVITASGDYWAQATNTCAASGRTQFYINVSGAAPVITVTPSSSTVCAGQSATLVATGATSYLWSSSLPPGATVVATPSITTTYSVLGNNGTCNGTQTITINVATTPTVNITASSSTLCSGSTASLTASGATTYSWSTGATTTVIAVSPTITTVYTATGTTSTCKDTQTLSITVVANPTVGVSASSPSICSGSNSTLTASGASTYSWSTGATGTSITVSPTITTVYTATGTAASTCKNTQTLSLTVNPNPTVTVNNYTICAGGTATLIASGASTYSWNTGATAASTTVAPSSNTNYTVTGTSFGTCTNTKTLSVTVGSALSILITPSSPTICIGNSGTLTTSGATSYTWNTGSNATSIVVSPTTTTNYTVTGTSGACSGTNTISVAVSANPTVAAVSSSSLICTGSSATLSATGATSYNWNPGSLSGTSVVVSPTTSVTYTVVGSNAAGCTNTRTVSVTVSACTGINEAQVTNSIISIYPNPNNGEFTLVVPEVGMYMIVNSIGQTIETIEVNENAQTISVQGLADGIYYVIGKSAKAKIVVSK